MINAEPSSSTNNNKVERKITKSQMKIKKYIEKIGEGATGKVQNYLIKIELNSMSNNNKTFLGRTRFKHYVLILC